MNSFHWDSWLSKNSQRIENILCEVLPSENTLPQRLHQAMAYALYAGGKRIRPLLLLASSELGESIDPKLHPEIERAAAAIEMLHTYSLVHDDLPCMDNDDLRRGKPTTHKAFDEATALLVGDALQTQAFILLADLKIPAQSQVGLIRELATASGSFGMAGGQAIDLQSVGIALDRPALEMMHKMKTGALLKASVRMGAILGSLSNTQKESLDQFADALGLGFQVVDDILDATQDSQTLGKTAGKDAQADKPTFVSLMGLEQAKNLALELQQTALNALSSWGAQADPLRAIALWVVARKY